MDIEISFPHKHNERLSQVAYCPQCGHARTGPGEKNCTACRANLLMFEPYTYIEPNLGISILGCVDMINGRFGRLKVARILKGSASQFIYRNEYHKSPYYGILRGMSMNSILFLLNELIKKGYLTVEVDDDGKYPLLVITQKGLTIIQGKDIVACSVPVALLLEPEDPVPNDKLDVLENLRDLRSSFAQAEEVEAYWIFTDETLKELVRQMPRTTDDLLNIPGIGPKTIERYGGAILHTIDEFRMDNISDEQDVTRDVKTNQ